MKKTHSAIALCGILSTCMFAHSAPVPPPAPYGAIPTANHLKWHGMEVYGLLCFNMATFKNVEWDDGATPVEKFNPTDFRPEQIMRACKAGGLRGMIFVTKHHDGFCTWPTKTTEYSIKNTPWKNGKGDLLKEMVDATRAQGMKVGMYLSPWDRNHYTYGTPEYIKVYREQMRELLINYGPIIEFWLDGANGGTGWYGGSTITTRWIDTLTYYDWDNTLTIVGELQPDASIFGHCGPDLRWCGNEDGSTSPKTSVLGVLLRRKTLLGGFRNTPSTYCVSSRVKMAQVTSEFTL